MIGGIPPARNRSAAIRPHWLPIFDVAACAASAGLAESLGARVILPPMKVPEVGTISVIADPQGAVFSVFEGK